jgi:predicted component of type VI protein secretion system
MRRLNGAMEMNDLGTLLDMELELPDVDQEMPGPTRGARIAWATAEIARLETALSRRVGELAALRASSGYDLWSRVEREPGILDRLEGELRTELAAAQMELHALARQHDDLVANVVRGGAS